MNRLNKLTRMLVISLLAGSMVITPVLAAPDVDSIQQQKDAAQSQVDSLQKQLNETISKINSLEEDLVKTGEEITKATDDLAAAEKKADQQYEDMKLRIKYMYENGSGADLEKIFESESFADALSQAEYVQNVHKYDRQQLEEYIETKEQIEELKKTKEEQMNNLEKQQAEYDSQKASLDKTLTEKKDQVSNLDAQLQAAVAQAEAERRAAEEKAAAEQTAKETSSTNRNDNNDNADTTVAPPANKPSGGNSGSTGGSGNTSVAAAIVSAAYSCLGTPYVWGGNTPGVGLDCSGLVAYAYAQAGISVPRFSGSLGAGPRVSNPQPGDVFCQPGHVGIYIGNGQVIHAPTEGEVVKISNVWGNYWFTRWW